MTARISTIIFCAIICASLVRGQELKTKTAPEFTLKNIDGKKVSLTDYYGNGPVYISFWATWCKPCREELKIVQEMYEKYQECGFKVVAINTDGPKASGKIRSFVKSNGWTFDVLIDEDGEVFRRKYKGFGMPYTVMTDPDGNIIFSAVGFRPGDENRVEELILQHVNQDTCAIDKTDAEE